MWYMLYVNGFDVTCFEMAPKKIFLFLDWFNQISAAVCNYPFSEIKCLLEQFLVEEGIFTWNTQKPFRPPFLKNRTRKTHILENYETGWSLCLIIFVGNKLFVISLCQKLSRLIEIVGCCGKSNGLGSW